MDRGDPRVGAVSRALLPSLGPREFVEEWSTIDGWTEFPVVTDSGPNNPRSHFLLPSRNSNPTSIYLSDQMGPDELFVVGGAELVMSITRLPISPEVNQLAIDMTRVE